MANGTEERSLKVEDRVEIIETGHELEGYTGNITRIYRGIILVDFGFEREEFYSEFLRLVEESEDAS